MTKQEAFALRSFDEYCHCGGFSGMTGRPDNDIHLYYCRQREQWMQWYALTHDAAGNDLRPNKEPTR